MKSKKKKNDTKNNILIVIALLLIIVIISGGTYAWWQWQSSNAQKTNVTITISKPNFEIVADSISSSTMTPTYYCYNSTEQGIEFGAYSVAAVEELEQKYEKVEHEIATWQGDPNDPTSRQPGPHPKRPARNGRRSCRQGKDDGVFDPSFPRYQQGSEEDAHQVRRSYLS